VAETQADWRPVEADVETAGRQGIAPDETGAVPGISRRAGPTPAAGDL